MFQNELRRQLLSKMIRPLDIHRARHYTNKTDHFLNNPTEHKRSVARPHINPHAHSTQKTKMNILTHLPPGNLTKKATIGPSNIRRTKFEI